MHGYQIIQELAERTGGVWRPSPGSVYPTLQQLEDEDLVRETASESGKRVYELTDAGREQAAASPRRGARSPARATTRSSTLHELAHQVIAATRQVAHAGTAAQTRGRPGRAARRAPQPLPAPRRGRGRVLALRGKGGEAVRLPRPSRLQSIVCFARKRPSGSTSARIAVSRS